MYDVEVFGGVRVQRRGQDAAVAERTRPKLHAALHPGNDLLGIQIAHGAIEQFVGGHQIVEAQFAILQYLLHLFGGVAGSQTKIMQCRALLLFEYVVPGVKHGA